MRRRDEARPAFPPFGDIPYVPEGCLYGRFDPFTEPSANGRCLRVAVVLAQLKSPIAVIWRSMVVRTVVGTFCILRGAG
jgi:hypothetical protein